jgi:glycosyltransferase involved in cell wall biosynthesis
MNHRLRVLLLAEQLRRAAPGGIGTYVRGLLQGLDELEPAERPETELLASRTPRGGPDPLEVFGHAVRTSPLPARLLTRAWDHGLVRAPGGFDVVHAVSLATPDPGGTALVVTVHDLLWRRVPEAFPAHGRRWHEAALRRALERAAGFVVPSAVVADDLCRAGARRDAVTVIPMGTDHLPAPDHDGARRLLAGASVGSPFLLSVATIEPRKNQRRMVEAYTAARARLPGPWPLVLVGPSGWGGGIAPTDGVVPVGPVAPAVLAALYVEARLLVYVPLIEGFGLPPVEAMRVGTPVVASAVPSTDGAALEVDPYDVDSIADGIVTGATDEILRSRLRELGTARSAELTWSSIARRHLAVWDGAAARAADRHG